MRTKTRAGGFIAAAKSAAFWVSILAVPVAASMIAGRLIGPETILIVVQVILYAVIAANGIYNLAATIRSNGGRTRTLAATRLVLAVVIPVVAAVVLWWLVAMLRADFLKMFA